MSTIHPGVHGSRDPVKHQKIMMFCIMSLGCSAFQLENPLQDCVFLVYLKSKTWQVFVGRGIYKILPSKPVVFTTK